MVLNFQLTKEDLAAFHLHLYRVLPSMRQRQMVYRSLAAFVVFFLVAGVLYLLGSLTLEWYFLVIEFGLAIPTFFIYPIIDEKLYRQKSLKTIEEGRNKDLVGDCTVSIDETSITSTTNRGDFHEFWTTVQRIEETDTYTYIFVSDVSAFIIPRRVFSTPDDYQTFRDTLTKYHDAAMESLQADETDEMDESDERATEEREESAERVG
jgi:hypothetical protein